MAVQFRLAALGHTMEKGRIVEWFVAEGATVKEGEPLLAVETDKATVDVDAPIEGVLLRIVGEVDVEYAVGTTLAWIGEAGEDIPDAPESAAPEPTAAVSAGAGRATPVARRLAERHGIDADSLEGSGPNGRITKEDVQRAIESGVAAAARGTDDGVTRVPLTGIRRTAAERLSASWRETPQVSEGVEVDFTDCLAIRAERMPAWRDTYGVEPTINDIVLKAATEALKSHMALNASLIDGAVAQYAEINLGVAVEVEDGLVVPVIHGTGAMNIGELADAVIGLSERARAGRLGLDELEGGTFTVTNLGGLGIDWFTPVLNPPQCAILGVGRVRRVPAVVGDDIVARDRANLVLTFDHRVIDGAPCARYLSELKAMIERPEGWLA